MVDIGDKAEAIAKVRKLLALARGKGASENEAAVAMRMAQAIIARLNLDIAEIDAMPVQGSSFEEDSELVTSSEPWRRELAAETARLYFCEYIYQFIKYATPKRKNGYIRGDVHTFVGQTHNIVVAKEMFVYFVDTIDALAKQHSKGKSARRSFCNGAAQRLGERIRERYFDSKNPVERGIIGMTKLPVLYESQEAALSAYMDAKHSTAVVKENNRQKIVDAEAALAGQNAADGIGLDTQIGNTAAEFAIGKTN